MVHFQPSLSTLSVNTVVLLCTQCLVQSISFGMAGELCLTLHSFFIFIVSGECPHILSCSTYIL